MKRNLFKTKVLVWMLLIMSSLSNNTFGQEPPPGSIDAIGTCFNAPGRTFNKFNYSGILSGTPGRHTFTSYFNDASKRVRWENNRWEIQSSADNGVSFAAIYYNLYPSAPYPPTFGTGTWEAVGNCDPLTQFIGTGTQNNLGTGPAPSITTTFTQVPPICKGATLAALPTTSTNMPTGIIGTWAPAINNLATTTYTFTPIFWQDASTATMTIVVNAPAAPTAASPQSLCAVQKVADLVANGTGLQWYNASSGGSALPTTTVLTATTYHVSQTVNGCESNRTPVQVLLTVGPTVQANSINTSPMACNVGSIGFTPNITTINTVLIDETFNLPANTNVWTKYNDAVHETGGQNFVKLTTNDYNKKGQVLFAKTSAAPKAFEMSFQAFIFNQSGADGFSVNYGEISNVQSLIEEGNSTGLVLRFKDYNQDRIQLVYNNVQIGSDYNLTLEDGNWWIYTITMTDNGQISLKRKRLDNTGVEVSIFSNVTIPNYTTTANYQWAFAGRTGGERNEHIIDAVKFTDKTPLQFSYDQTNWQTTTTFTNVPAGLQTVYARKGSTGCAASLTGGTINVLGTPATTPTFTQVAPICKGATLAALPTSSTNTTAITGTWVQAINNMATTTYTFTPTAGQCANTATMTITVNEPITPTFSGNTVVLDKKNSDVANYSPFVVTTAATYRIELWGKGGGNSPDLGGGAGGYSGTETILAPASYNIGFSTTSPLQTYFLTPGANSRMNAENTNVQSAVIIMVANNGNSTTGGNASGGSKNIKGGNGSLYTGGGAAGWWGHNGASLDGTMTAGGDSGTPDNSSDGGDPYKDGKFPGGGPGRGGFPAEGRILITKIEPLPTSICKGATINPLPTTSVEGITGTWSPSTINNMATTTYTFTPATGQCANTATLTITVNEPVTSTFTQVAPICKGASLAALPTASTNNITGTWAPALNNQATTTYTFTPAAGQCGSTATMEIVVKSSPAAPTANSPQTFCEGSTGADLVASGTNLNWYIDGPFGPIAVNSSTILQNTRYNVYQTVDGCNSLRTIVDVTLKAKVTPTFTQVAPICKGANLTALPTTSTNNITGTWAPAVNNMATTTYTFTPDAGQCALGIATMTIVVNNLPALPEITGNATNVFKVYTQNIGTCPDFRGTFGNPQSSGPAVTYFNTSNGGSKLEYFNQKWSLYLPGSPVAVITNTEPTQGITPPETGWVISPQYNCVSAPITVTAIKQLTFCEGATVFNLKQNLSIGDLKFYDENNNPIYTSNTGSLITGSIFVSQTSNGCESAKLPLYILVKTKITPTFFQVNPVCKGEALYITNLSNNGVIGTWAPAFNNQATTTYTFTPESGICANTATMTVVVNNCSVISGTVLEDADAGTISGIPITVTNAYLSIYKVGEVSLARISFGVEPVIPPLHVVAIVNGAYAFPKLAKGKYKIVIGTSANGSEIASYPNVGNFSMTSSAEGQTGTMGDGTPDGITYVTVSDGATVYSGSRIMADAGISFALKQNAPLPVRLVSFTGKNTEKGNVLNWKTSSEVNFSHFEVERSGDAKKFEKIGKVNGNKGEVYEFLDVSSNNALSYYRLKMVDLDGTSAYSKVIALAIEKAKAMVGQFYPNPAFGNEASININSTEAQNWTITSYDISGKFLTTETKFLNKGENKVRINLGKSQNMQLFRFENGTETQYRKVIK
jgi:hypothetical protein